MRAQGDTLRSALTHNLKKRNHKTKRQVKLRFEETSAEEESYQHPFMVRTRAPAKVSSSGGGRVEEKGRQLDIEGVEPGPLVFEAEAVGSRKAVVLDMSHVKSIEEGMKR